MRRSALHALRWPSQQQPRSGATSPTALRLCPLTYLHHLNKAGMNHSNHEIDACNMLKAGKHQLQFTVQAEACKLAATSAQLESFAADHRLALLHVHRLLPSCAQLCFCCFWA